MMVIGLTMILWSILDTTDQEGKILYQWIAITGGQHDR